MQPSKADILADLDRARSAIVRQSVRASEQVSPVAWLKRNFATHPVAWSIGAAFLGVLATRTLLFTRSPKKDRDIFPKSGTKAWLFRLLQGPLVSVGQKALLNYASQYLKNHLNQPVPPPNQERNPT